MLSTRDARSAGMKTGGSRTPSFSAILTSPTGMASSSAFTASRSGFITWDPRNRPEYVEIGHNGIRTACKGRGFGKAQLKEALRRIREYEGLKEIRVLTNSNLVAPRNYESARFVLYDRKENKETPFSGDYLWKYRTNGRHVWRCHFRHAHPANSLTCRQQACEICRRA